MRLCSLSDTEVIDPLYEIRHLLMRISEVWGAWASTRYQEAFTRSEGAANFLTLNTKAFDTIHSRAGLNGSDRHIGTEVLYECEHIGTGYQN